MWRWSLELRVGNILFQRASFFFGYEIVAHDLLRNSYQYIQNTFYNTTHTQNNQFADNLHVDYKRKWLFTLSELNGWWPKIKN